MKTVETIGFQLTFDGSKMMSSIENVCAKVEDKFQSSFNKAGISATKAIKTNNNEINRILEDTGRSAKSKAASIAAIYKKQGDSQQEAFQKAWSHIERSSYSGTKKVNKHLQEIENKSEKVSNNIKNNFTGSFSAIAKKVATVLAGAFAVSKLVQFGKRCLELGSDLQEVQNVVDVTFPTMTKKVDDFAQSAAASFGLSETMAKKYTGTFGTMARSFGFAESAAYDMGTTLTALAGDVASFYNIAQDEAYTKLKSVFTGETESLKELGVVMTQSALDAYALANGFGKTTSAMNEAEKVALRYQFVQSKLATATGDFARTSGGWANQVRVLKLQMESFMSSVGQGLINLFTPAIQVINTLMSKLVALANVFKNFTEVITGKSQGSVSSVASNINGITESATTAQGAVSGIGDSAKAAAKKAMGLGKIDELNNISTKTNDSSGGSGGAGGSSPGMITSDPTASIDSEQPTILEKKFSKLAESFERFKTSASNLANTIKNGLAWCFENILKPFGKWTLNEVAPVVLDLLATAFDILNSTLKAWQPLWQWTWDNFLLPIANFAGDVFITFLKGVTNKLNEFSDWCNTNQETIRIATELLAMYFGAWKVTELFAFIQMSGGLVGAFQVITTAIKNATVAKLLDKAETIYLTALYAKDFVVSTGKSVAALAKQAAGFIASTAAKIADTAAQIAMTAATVIWNGVCAIATTVTTAFGAAVAFLTSPIGLVIVAITALIAAGVLLYKNWDEVREFGLNAWAKIKEGISKVVEKIKEIFGSIVGWFQQKYKEIQNVFSSVSTWFGDKFSAAYNAVKKPFQSIGSFFSGVYNTVKSKFKSIGSAAGDAIGGAFKSVINSVLGTVENTINKAIGFINSAIGTINELPGVNIKKLGTVKLPRLAQGGYVKKNTPQLAMIGDNRHQGEVVAPEDKLRQMALEAVQMAKGTSNNEALLLQMIRLLQRQVDLLVAILEKETGISGTDVFNIVRDYAREYTERTGEPAFEY